MVLLLITGTSSHPLSIPSPIQKLFREYLLCARSFPGHRRYNNESDATLPLKNSSFNGKDRYANKQLQSKVIPGGLRAVIAVANMSWSLREIIHIYCLISSPQ